MDRTGLGALLLPVSGFQSASTVPVVGLTRAMWLRIWALVLPRAPNLVNSPPTYSQEPDSARDVTVNDFDGWFCVPTTAGWKFVSRLPSARMWARPLTWTSLSLGKLPPTNQPPFPSGVAAMSSPASILGNPGCGAPLWPSTAPASA